MKTLLSISLLLLAVIAISGCEQKTETLASFTLVAVDSGSVFSHTQGNYSVDYDSLEVGVFVKSIENVSQSKQAYWLYSVNSEPGNVACNLFQVAPGDTIVWKLMSLY